MNKTVTLLTLVLTITMIAGCGKNKNNPQQNTIATTTVTTIATEQENTTEDAIPVETPPTRPIETNLPKHNESTSPTTEAPKPSETVPPATESSVSELGENQTPPAIR